MGSNAPTPHMVLVPFPAQGHVAPLIQLARLHHAHGARVTFVYTQYNYPRLVRAKGEAAVATSSSDKFRVEVIDDGLSLSVPQNNVVGLVNSLRHNCLNPFCTLLRRQGQEAQEQGASPVTCVVGDVVMTFTAAAAREAAIPGVQFFMASACGLMGYLHYSDLVKRGLVPFNDASCLTNNGYLDTKRERQLLLAKLHEALNKP